MTAGIHYLFESQFGFERSNLLFAQERDFTHSDSVPSCAISRLRLRNFRNYTQLSLDLRASIVVLSGANGSGKTNLLEAISFLAPGRGLRRSRLREVQKTDTVSDTNTGWVVAASVYGPLGSAKISSRLGKTNKGTDCRLTRNDGAPVQPSSLSQLIGIQWLTPQMDRLFVEGPSPRRRFLDRLVLGLHPDHGRRVRSYERSLQERARLQRAGNVDLAWLSAIEARIAADGVAIAAARNETLTKLHQYLAETPGKFPRPELVVEGRLEAGLEELPAVEVERRFADFLARNRQRDFETRTTCEGPHRSDLVVHHSVNGQPAAKCSTGEQKALLISIVLANARAEAQRRGAAPILLLDEVTAHLDQKRRNALFEELQSLGGQAWLSGTDRNLFAPLTEGTQFISVNGAHTISEG